MHWEGSHPFRVSRSLKWGHVGCFSGQGWSTLEAPAAGPPRHVAPVPVPGMPVPPYASAALQCIAPGSVQIPLALSSLWAFPSSWLLPPNTQLIFAFPSPFCCNRAVCLGLLHWPSLLSVTEFCSFLCSVQPMLSAPSSPSTLTSTLVPVIPQTFKAPLVPDDLPLALSKTSGSTGAITPFLF